MSPESLAVSFKKSCDSCSARRWVIALSGGLDSIALLHLSAKLLPANKLYVLHINHNLQPEATSWADFCRSQASEMSLPFSQVDVQPESSSEEAARNARYQAFSDFLKEGDVLLLAHHADDQAETLLFRLMRGTGLNGLSGMPLSRPLGQGTLLRPLLNVTRLELENWVKAQELDWIEDPTNRKDHYDRNFLRLNILPKLGSRWPGMQKRLADTAQLLRQEQSLLNDYLDTDLAGYKNPQSGLNISEWVELSEWKKKALLRRWVSLESGLLLNDMELHQIVSDVVMAGEDKEPQFHLGSMVIRRYRKTLFLCKWATQAEPLNFPFVIEKNSLSDGVLSTANTSVGLRISYGKEDSFMWHRLTNLDVVNVKPCNRPTKSLKKLFQEKGVPPWFRQNWPVLMAEDEVVAIPSICICEGWQETCDEKPGFVVNWQPF